MNKKIKCTEIINIEAEREPADELTITNLQLIVDEFVSLYLKLHFNAVYSRCENLNDLAP